MKKNEECKGVYTWIWSVVDKVNLHGNRIKTAQKVYETR
jgi:hypothetical protein